MIGETNHEYAQTLAFLYSGGVLRELLDIPAEQTSTIAFNDNGELKLTSKTIGASSGFTIAGQALDIQGASTAAGPDLICDGHRKSLGVFCLMHDLQL